MPQVVQTLKSLSSVALLAVSQLCTMVRSRLPPPGPSLLREFCSTTAGKINLTKPSRFKTNPPHQTQPTKPPDQGLRLAGNLDLAHVIYVERDLRALVTFGVSRR